MNTTVAPHYQYIPTSPAPSVTPLIEIDQVSVLFDQRLVLNKVSLTLAPREIVSLIGPNGAGKSTLVKVVLGLQKTSSGTRQVHGDLKIGYVPQRFHLSRSMPLRVRDLFDLTRTTADFRKQILEETGSANLLNRDVQDLSGGERQRVLLARALLIRPNLLVLDEPMQGLDIHSEEELYAYVRTLPERYGCAVLMVSHDLQWVMQGTQRVICLNQHICCSGTPASVLQDPAYQAIFGTERVPYEHHHDHCRHEDLHHEHHNHDSAPPHIHPEVAIDLLEPTSIETKKEAGQ
ncbi:MAG TPA: ATP-binding cassette domain-containing protein [Aquirhabdus sp.]